ncbi:MAG: aldo/keto reductase [Atopobiaceae bacterium]|nr:aldo/keto reductase [Atopobiaceae bacterium]
MAYLGEGTPKLGFGLMRLPKLEDGSIDIAQVSQMVDEFLAAGCTYFDTARAYGESESATRRALIERHPRESFTLATKNAAWLGANSQEEARGFFDTSLKETGAGYFDYYLLHNLGGTRTEIFDKWGMWDWVRSLKEEGRIRHWGFSYHDNAENLDRLLDAHPDAEFVQLQINYADWDDLAVQSRACWEVARAHEKPVVIMEPVKGGMLAAPPVAVADILHEAHAERSPVEWALRFAMNLEGVLTVLSGMSSLEQMRQNLETLKNLSALTEHEQQVLAEARSVLHDLIEVPCTSCHYCMDDCPVHMNISSIMESINRDVMYGHDAGLHNYGFAARDVKASECIQCYQCEGVCPQHINIVTRLEQAASLFE